MFNSQGFLGLGIKNFRIEHWSDPSLKRSFHETNGPYFFVLSSCLEPDAGPAVTDTREAGDSRTDRGHRHRPKRSERSWSRSDFEKPVLARAGIRAFQIRILRHT